MYCVVSSSEKYYSEKTCPLHNGQLKKTHAEIILKLPILLKQLLPQKQRLRHRNALGFTYIYQLIAAVVVAQNYVFRC